MKHRVALSLLIAFAAALPRPADASSKSLRGSRASMEHQNEIARKSDYSFLRTPKQVKAAVEAGRLVQLEGNDDYRLARVSYPYGRLEVKLFVERLAADYHAACGEQLVVTSVTRPISKQPANAHPLSVHPAGMAVDLRISKSAGCLDWLESTLLDLEDQDLLDVTREYHPAHLHVAVFPQAYRDHVEKLIAEEAAKLPGETPAAAAPKPAIASLVPETRRSNWLVIVPGVLVVLMAAVSTKRRSRRS